MVFKKLSVLYFCGIFLFAAGLPANTTDLDFVDFEDDVFSNENATLNLYSNASNIDHVNEFPFEANGGENVMYELPDEEGPTDRSLKKTVVALAIIKKVHDLMTTTPAPTPLVPTPLVPTVFSCPEGLIEILPGVCGLPENVPILRKANLRKSKKVSNKTKKLKKKGALKDCECESESSSSEECECEEPSEEECEESSEECESESESSEECEESSEECESESESSEECEESSEECESESESSEECEESSEECESESESSEECEESSEECESESESSEECEESSEECESESESSEECEESSEECESESSEECESESESSEECEESSEECESESESSEEKDECDDECEESESEESDECEDECEEEEEEEEECEESEEESEEEEEESEELGLSPEKEALVSKLIKFKIWAVMRWMRMNGYRGPLQEWFLSQARQRRRKAFLTALNRRKKGSRPNQGLIKKQENKLKPIGNSNPPKQKKPSTIIGALQKGQGNQIKKGAHKSAKKENVNKNKINKQTEKKTVPKAEKKTNESLKDKTVNKKNQ